jgi:CubicO group peptidase (beta-lactamase class C family)
MGEARSSDTGGWDAALEALRTRARREVDDGILPAAQWAVAINGEVVAGETVGDVPAGDVSRFVVYSATKAVVASAVWQLLAEGSLHLDDRVADHVPEFKTNGKDVVTVEQVLLHTSGFPQAPMSLTKAATRDGRLEAFSRWRLNWEPGSRFEYHPTSAHWVLAELLERIDGDDFRAVVRRRVLEPLGLTALQLGVPEDDQGDVARPVNVGEPPTPEEWEAVLGIPGFDVGEVTDEALVTLGSPEGIAIGVPGGGAVSTAADLARFYQALLRNDAGLWDPAVLADATGTVRNTFRDPQTGVPANRALSIVVAGDDGKAGMRGMGHTCSPRAFGHNGAGGQIAFGDPETGVSFCWFTNGLDRHLIRQWRRTAGIASKAGALVPATNT